MEEKKLIKNISVVNEGQIIVSDVFIDKGIIQKIGAHNDKKNQG